MSNLQLAIIGFGNMGKIHYKAVSKNTSCKKPIIVDSNQELQDEFENLDFFHDFDDFISSNIDKIDGAIISTPSSLHLEHAKPFISKGIPLLIEKPLTSDYSSDEELFKLARRNNSFLKCGLIELYNPIIEELSNADFEDLKFVHFKRHSPKTSESRKLENIILDLTLHDISIIYKVFKPKNIEIIGCELSHENNVAESAQILLKIDDSYSIFISSSRQDQEKIRTIEIVDENMTYQCDLKNKFYETKQNGKIASFDSKSITESNILKKVDMLNKPETAELQIQSFVDSILNNDEDLQSLHIAENTHKLAYEILDF
jgi:predicted dehydrogenase